MPRVDKQTNKQLKEYAKGLPLMEDRKRPIYRVIFGWQILENPDSSNQDKDGNPIKPNKKYQVLQGYDQVNHLKNLKKIYVKYGWQGVKRYHKNVMDRIAEPDKDD